MTIEQVDNRALELFVNQKYHWKSLPPSQQRAIAVELMRHKFIEKKLYDFVESMIEDKEAFSQYRQLLVEEATKQT